MNYPRVLLVVLILGTLFLVGNQGFSGLHWLVGVIGLVSGYVIREAEGIR